MNATEITAAIEEASKKIIEIEQDCQNEVAKAETTEQRHEVISRFMRLKKEKGEVKVGRITVVATLGGNTKASHVRVSYKIDGKRASKAKVEEMLK